jgi:hypothetical protein
MSKVNTIDLRFGEIAIELKLLDREKLDRALVVQRCVYDRTQVHMPIGKVLKEMGVLNQGQVDSVLEAQREAGLEQHLNPGKADQDPFISNGLNLTISKDCLAAYLSPDGETLNNITLTMVKQLLAEHGVVYGLISDESISAYLESSTLPVEPFRVAYGKPPKEGRPPEIKFHFETDPVRVGTVLEDGTMDWKNRGEVPEVKIGELLAEKAGGAPGKPGTAVTGEEIPPPKIKEPQIKCARGVERSEDGYQVFAKLDGMPKLTPDGRVTVMSVLPIEGDIGLETGHVDFDGYIEVDGGISTGYHVKGRGLRVREIQDAEVEISEDLVSYGGIYGSIVQVGGNVKASHIHNTNMQVVGDLVVEKEIIGSNIEVNGRVIVDRGKIISSKVTAKKGIEARDVGTEASMPSELVVGVDRKYEREMQKCKEALAEAAKREGELNADEEQLKKQLDNTGTDLGKAAQEQDKYMVQKRRLEEKLIGPKAVKNENERAVLVELVEELSQRQETIDQKVNALMEEDDALRVRLNECQKTQVEAREEQATLQNEIDLLDMGLKADPGIPVAKIYGTVYARTTIAGVHKRMKLPEDMKSVRIAESKDEAGAQAWKIKISNLR